MKDYAVYIGIGAGALTAVSMLPQLFKILKEKKAEDISFGMLIVLLAGVAGWIWYGIVKTDYPIIATNSFSFLVNSVVLGLSIRYKNSA
jgi:MtN3 and saliva related transmembrane protein